MQPADPPPAECSGWLGGGCAVPAWMRRVLLAAAFYNLAFGVWATFWPEAWFTISGLTPPAYPDVWRCLGMVVGVYGLGYAIAAINPLRHWPIILVGLLGKVLGPLGFVTAVAAGRLPLRAGWMLLANDLIWWVPFGMILWAAARAHLGSAPASHGPALALPDACATFRLTSGETLAEASAKQTVVLVFLRHFGCTFTRQLLLGLQQLESQASAHGARLVLVHMLRDGGEAGYLSNAGNVARIADPRCQLYRAFGLGRGSLLELFGPRVWLLGLAALAKGCGAGHLAGDGMQMPGAFLVRDSRILAAQRARSAADLPDLAALFKDAARAS